MDLTFIFISNLSDRISDEFALTVPNINKATISNTSLRLKGISALRKCPFLPS